MLKSVINAVKDVLYPGACPLCGKPAPVVEGSRLLACPECLDELETVGNVYCLKCGQEIKGYDKQYCYDCARVKHVYDQGAAALAYTENIKQSIYRYKYKGKREYAEWYGQILAKECGSRIRMWGPDVIVPVPLHPKKLKSRGYNQAALMAKALGRELGINVDCDYLARVHNTAPMKKLTTEERIKNLKNAFIINKNDVKYNKILLVDDIYTTGATVDACAAVLKAGGVRDVYCISLCVGKGI